MAGYQTEQRRLLMDFFQQHPHSSFTAREIAAALLPQGVSQSAVYRNLSAMTKEGTVRRSVRGESREAVYQYIRDVQCQGKLHLTCTRCGNICHMSQGVAQSVEHQLEESHGFVLDSGATVLYGLCRDCAKKEDK